MSIGKNAHFKHLLNFHPKNSCPQKNKLNNLKLQRNGP
jgi:hypothetical protein